LPAELVALVRDLRAQADCFVHPPRGHPELPQQFVLPADLARFYELCGGATLFAGASLPLRVCGPDEFVPAAPRLLTHAIAAEQRRTDPEGVVSTCFVLVDNGEGAATDEHVVVDLHPERLGRCYATFWDCFGLRGDMPIVAFGVADMLEALLRSGSEGLDGLASLGDAYD
jgi:hypothetical protein